MSVHTSKISQRPDASLYGPLNVYEDGDGKQETLPEVRMNYPFGIRIAIVQLV